MGFLTVAHQKSPQIGHRLAKEAQPQRGLLVNRLAPWQAGQPPDEVASLTTGPEHIHEPDITIAVATV